MEAKRLQILITEIFKTLNNSNPVFMKDIFHYCINKNDKKHNLHVHSRNTSRYEKTAFVYSLTMSFPRPYFNPYIY